MAWVQIYEQKSISFTVLQKKKNTKYKISVVKVHNIFFFQSYHKRNGAKKKTPTRVWYENKRGLHIIFTVAGNLYFPDNFLLWQ